jgi:hypothetical protein
MSLIAHVPHVPQLHVPHLHVPHPHLWHAAEPKHPYYPSTYEFLENGCMSREMDRL